MALIATQQARSNTPFFLLLVSLNVAHYLFILVSRNSTSSLQFMFSPTLVLAVDLKNRFVE